MGEISVEHAIWHVAPFIRVTRIGELGMLAVTSNRIVGSYKSHMA
jgi:hypothetical protein